MAAQDFTGTAAGAYYNPSYRIDLLVTNPNSEQTTTRISTFMPEEIAINMTSSWESVAKNFIDSFAGSEAAGNILSVLGKKTMLTNYNTLSSWTGNSPLEFNIPFRFDAIRDPYADVLQPLSTLYQLAAPSQTENQMLTAPGPSLSFIDKELAWEGSTTIALRVGRFLYIKPILITGVSGTVVSKFDKNGYPMAAEVEVSMKTLFAPTVQDIKSWFAADDSYSQTRDISKYIGLLKEGYQQGKQIIKNATGLIGGD